jgi:hypothetical protein
MRSDNWVSVWWWSSFLFSHVPPPRFLNNSRVRKFSIYFQPLFYYNNDFRPVSVFDTSVCLYLLLPSSPPLPQHIHENFRTVVFIPSGQCVVASDGLSPSPHLLIHKKFSSSFWPIQILLFESRQDQSEWEWHNDRIITWIWCDWNLLKLNVCSFVLRVPRITCHWKTVNMNFFLFHLHLFWSFCGYFSNYFDVGSCV